MEMFLMEKYAIPPSDINNMVMMDFEFMYDKAVRETEPKQDTGDFSKLEEQIMVHGQVLAGVKI
jgi:hypothetical protein